MYRFYNIYFSLKLDITRRIERLSHISTEFTSKRAIEVYLILEIHVILNMSHVLSIPRFCMYQES